MKHEETTGAVAPPFERGVGRLESERANLRTLTPELLAAEDAAGGVFAAGALASERTPEPAAQAFGIIDPDYARIFTQARIIAWQYGYACLAHGTFTRDLDLLLVPWADRHVPDASGVVNRIADVAGLRLQGPPSDKPHGRKAWTLLLPGFSEVRWVDVSAFARHEPPNVRAKPQP